jgi:hypothetical protein
MIRKLIALSAALVASTCVGLSQGVVSFNNRVLADDGVTFLVNAPVFNTDGVTALSGNTFLAGLYAGSSADSLSLVGSAVAFRTGTRAGYVDISSPDRVIQGVAAGATAFVQIRAWAASAGATYDAAVASGGLRGFSNTISVTTGGAGNPPSLPANLVGLQSFALVPEPSVIALAVLGAGALFFRRKKA